MRCTLPMRGSWLYLIAVLAGGATAPADAAPPRGPSAPAEPARTEAKRHFDRGIALYNDNDLDAALTEFEASYQTYPTAGVLYNIGIVHKALHRYSEAITALERYLADAKSPPRERVAEVTQLIAEMRALIGQLALTITPAGASVVVDGRSVGTAPLAPLSLGAGHHVIELAAAEHEPLRQEVTIMAGKPLALKLALKEVRKTGQARITVSPARAMILIDGRLVGTGATSVELPAGGHTLEVSAPGYQTQQRELHIATGQRRDVSVKLEGSVARTVHRRWWFWTVLGAGLGGGAAAVAVPLTSRAEPPTVGTLSPGNGRVN